MKTVYYIVTKTFSYKKKKDYLMSFNQYFINIFDVFSYVCFFFLLSSNVSEGVKRI